jgi:glycosyltransferase involved in cell wall biosynthesis
VVVPVYNEGENAVPTLRGLVEQTRTRPLEVLVVHDFDEDTTVPVVKRLQSELPELHLHRNDLGRGVLSALKSGLAAARAPYVLVTMGDGSDDPGDMDAMYALALGGADVVAGSRYMRGGGADHVAGPDRGRESFQVVEVAATLPALVLDRHRRPISKESLS